ncbi:MAG: tetratricopeptide repeat protein [Chitinophagales bacterium]
MKKADVIILLIDAKMLNHKYYKNEITAHLLKNEGKLLVQPILMRSCLYEYDAYLKKHQEYLKQNFPIGLLEMPKGKRGGIYKNIVTSITENTLEKNELSRTDIAKEQKQETKTESKSVKEEKSTKKAVFTLVAVLTMFLVGYLFFFKNEETRPTPLPEPPQKTEVTKNKNAIFSKNDEKRLNILILPFEDINQKEYEANDCIGRNIQISITDIAANKMGDLTLKANAIYADTIKRTETPTQARIKQKQHHADVLIYGLAKDVEENCTGAKMCFHYEISDFLVKQANANVDETVKASEFNRNYTERLNPSELNASKVKMGNVGLEYFIRAFTQIKGGDINGGLASLGKKDTIGLANQEKAEQYYNEALVAYKFAQYDKTLEALNKAIKLKPDEVKFYNIRGIAYSDLGKHEKAIEDYDKAISLDENDAKVYNNRGIAYYDLGKHEKAIEDYDKAISLDENDAKVYNNRGIAYYDLRKYIMMAENVNDISIYSYGGAVCTLGSTYTLERCEQALQDANKSIELNPKYKDAQKLKKLILQALEKQKK